VEVIGEVVANDGVVSRGAIGEKLKEREKHVLESGDGHG